MQRKTTVIALAVALLAVTGCAAYVASPAAQPGWHHGGLETDVTQFYAALAPYGDWLRVEPWGWVWTPLDVEPGWRPYTDGRWVWSSLGWTWVAEQPWGWAPFHYGRWTYDSHYGWLWIPDTVWAPAWVAWRVGNGWIGWAPLPPEVRWRIGIGIDLGGIDLGISIVQHGWCFVGERDFLDHRVRRRLEPLPRHGYLLRETHDRTLYEERERRVAVRGPDLDDLERRVGHIERYRLEDLDRPPREPEAVERDAVRVYRPEVRKEEPRAVEPRKEEPGREAKPVPEDEGRAVKVPPPARVDEEKPEKRLERDQRALKDWEKEQRQRLEEEQKRENRQPVAKETVDERTKRQETERRVLQKEVEREKTVIEERKVRKEKEREQAKEAPKERAKEKEKPKPPKPPAKPEEGGGR